MISTILSTMSRNSINSTFSSRSIPSISASTTAMSRFFSSSSTRALPSPRSNNQTPRAFKSHSGAKKRYSPVGRGSGSSLQMFKRGRTGKRHLNSGMARDRLNRLGGTVMERGGNVGKSLRRLLGPSL